MDTLAALVFGALALETWAKRLETTHYSLQVYGLDWGWRLFMFALCI